jgi:hypothetical protein
VKNWPSTGPEDILNRKNSLTRIDGSFKLKISWNWDQRFS